MWYILYKWLYILVFVGGTRQYSIDIEWQHALLIHYLDKKMNK